MQNRIFEKKLIMRISLFLAAIAMVSASCQSPSSDDAPSGTDSAAVDTTTSGDLEAYGDKITVDGAIPVEEMLALLEGRDSLEVKVRTTVQEVCQVKGCWMDVDLGDGNLMSVSFKDYGFFVPKDCSGREVVMEGVVKYEFESVEWLRHKAEDAGKSEDEIASITEPIESYQFVASGVILQ